MYRFSDPHGRVIYVGKAKSLRQRLNSYFADLVEPAPAHPADGHHRRARAVDGGHHRGGGAAARVQLDQGVRPAVQRPLPRRQDLPGARGDHERGVPAAARLPRPAAQGRALLRPVRARLGHPGDPGPAAARVPGPHLQRRGVQAARPDRPALPARLHRQVLGAVRRPGRPPTSTATSSTDFNDFLSGRTDQMLRELERRMAAASAELEFERAARLRDDIGALRRAMERQAVVLGDGTDADVVAFARGRAGGRGAGLPRARRAGPRAARLGGGQGGAHRHRAAGGAVPDPVLRRAGRAGRLGRRRAPAGAAGDPGAGAAGRAGVDLRVAVRAARLPGADPGAAARRQAGAGRDRGPQRGRGVHPAQAAPGRRPDRPLGRAGRDPGRARARLGAAAHRVHRRLARAGHQRGRLAGGLRGRAGPQVRVPPVRDPRRRGRRRRGVDRRGGPAPVPPLPVRDRRKRRDR